MELVLYLGWYRLEDDKVGDDKYTCTTTMVDQLMGHLSSIIQNLNENEKIDLAIGLRNGIIYFN